MQASSSTTTKNDFDFSVQDLNSNLDLKRHYTALFFIFIFFWL